MYARSTKTIPIYWAIGAVQKPLAQDYRFPTSTHRQIQFSKASSLVLYSFTAPSHHEHSFACSRWMSKLSPFLWLFHSLVIYHCLVFVLGLFVCSNSVDLNLMMLLSNFWIVDLPILNTWYIYISLVTSTYEHTHTHTYTYMYMYTHTHTYIHTYTRTRTHTHTHHTRTYTPRLHIPWHWQAHTRTTHIHATHIHTTPWHTYTYKCAHTHTHVRTHTTHTRTRSCAWKTSW